MLDILLNDRQKYDKFDFEMMEFVRISTQNTHTHTYPSKRIQHMLPFKMELESIK